MIPILITLPSFSSFPFRFFIPFFYLFRFLNRWCWFLYWWCWFLYWWCWFFTGGVGFFTGGVGFFTGGVGIFTGGVGFFTGGVGIFTGGVGFFTGNESLLGIMGGIPKDVTLFNKLSDNSSFLIRI